MKSETRVKPCHFGWGTYQGAHLNAPPWRGCRGLNTLKGNHVPLGVATPPREQESHDGSGTRQNDNLVD